MPKSASKFVCQECGHETAKWLGRCPGCGSWNAFAEERRSSGAQSHRSRAVGWLSPDALARDGLARASAPQPVTEIDGTDEPRLATGLSELDRVLGGGLVPGSLVLVGGDPGVGKSTLLLQVADRLATQQAQVLYVTGEESPRQLRLRAERLGTLGDELLVLSETDVQTVASHMGTMRPALVIVDSIQTMVDPALESAPGSVSQVREGAALINRVAKAEGIATLLVGHVNKAGMLAGPKVLEHVVDVVLALEGERHSGLRILRAAKNRFGATDEVGLFDMREGGLAPIPNPSALFLSERPVGSPGSVVVAGLEGSRPLLIELQALVGSAPYGGTPRRQATGVDPQRLSMLLAVLGRRIGLRVQDQDVYVNAVGGMRVDEPAADLGIALAICSSLRNLPIPEDLAVLGEVGLSGEVRAVQDPLRRASEAKALGFRKVMLPEGSLRKLTAEDRSFPSGCEPVPVRTVREAIGAAMEGA